MYLMGLNWGFEEIRNGGVVWLIEVGVVFMFELLVVVDLLNCWGGVVR